jgi:Cu2+-exporting ATPase
VWLVERMPMLLPGVQRAELDVRRALATVQWDVTALPLSRIATALDGLGYPPHPFRGVKAEVMRQKEDRRMLGDIGVAGAVAANVMLLALAMYSGWFSGMERQYDQLFRWLSLVLTIPALAGPGRVFFRGAWASVRARKLHMDVPVAIALGAGFVRGAYNTYAGQGPIYFDGVTTLTFLLLSGRFLQQRGQRAAADATALEASLTPQSARVVGDDRLVREVPAESLLPGMLLEVRAGDTLAADGVVEGGASSVDLSLLTGESRPVSVEVRDRVYAGTVNLRAPLAVRVTAAGETSRLGTLLRRLDEGAHRKAPVVLLADRVASWFVLTVLVLAALTYVVWLQRDATVALDNAIAMLIVTCPCALALATPLAFTVATGRAAGRGILIKGGDVLEALAHPGTLLLDKSGTVTEGHARLVSFDGPEPVRAYVLALEQHSSHPVALAFTRAWPNEHSFAATDVVQTLGGGICGTVDGHQVVVGAPAYVRALGATTPTEWRSSSSADGLSPVWVACDGVMVGEARFGDPLRPGAAAAIATLKRRGWQVSLLSGDADSAVQMAGRALGVDSAIGDASPEAKLAVVEGAAQRGSVVMVGDGVNDAAALAGASVGVAVHGGAEASLQVADVYLSRPGLDGLVELVEGAARTMTLIRNNIIFSVLYNVLGAALAFTGVIDPLIAAVVMPLSSVGVVVTSWRGRTFGPVGR